MVELARPSFLVAGALLALVPPILHLIVRRPPDRTPLPTARFLRPAHRTTIRLQRTPTDRWLLLLRSTLLLLTGLAFAGPSWAPRRTGTVELVLLDRGAGMGSAWADAVEAARGILGTESDGATGVLVLFDTATVWVPIGGRSATAILDSLLAAGPGDAAVDYMAALRSVRTILEGLPTTDSVRITLITRPRWEGWSPGLAVARESIWPGRVRVVAVGEVGKTGGRDGESMGDGEARDRDRGHGAGPGTADSAARDRARLIQPGRAVIVAQDDGGRYARAALQVLGWEVTGGGRVEAREAGLYLVLGGPGVEREADLVERARAGAVVVVAGASPDGPLAEAIPWTQTPLDPIPNSPTAADPPTRDGAPRTPPATRPGDLVLDTGPVIPGAAARIPGTPRPGARLLAAWSDGRPAAAAHAVGDGCIVYLAAPLEAGTLPLAPGFPDLVDRLAHGCAGPPAPSPGDVRPLDSAAHAVLEGRDSPWTVAASTVQTGPTGRPLSRWILLAVLALAGLETVAVYRRRRGR